MVSVTTTLNHVVRWKPHLDLYRNPGKMAVNKKDVRVHNMSPYLHRVVFFSQPFNPTHGNAELIGGSRHLKGVLGPGIAIAFKLPGNQRPLTNLDQISQRGLGRRVRK